MGNLSGCRVCPVLPHTVFGPQMEGRKDQRAEKVVGEAVLGWIWRGRAALPLVSLTTKS